MEKEGEGIYNNMAHCLPNHFHFQYKNKIAVNDKKRGYKT
jgi:hypothetical protein